jgi:hypothetical protein
MDQPNGLPSVSRNPHGYWHRTVQKTEQPVLAATSPQPLTPFYQLCQPVTAMYTVTSPFGWTSTIGARQVDGSESFALM